MKLIIDIPEEAYNVLLTEQVLPHINVEWLIMHGTPLDDVKAEMERANRAYPYTNHGILEAIAIIDKYIGKAESEGKLNET